MYATVGVWKGRRCQGRVGVRVNNGTGHLIHKTIDVAYWHEFDSCVQIPLFFVFLFFVFVFFFVFK